MDEIEYLEEYEDLILPTMSTQAATAKGRNRNNLVTMADDEDSSSIDQDIFDSLFDDNSDDESVMHKKGPAKLSQRSERSSRISRVSMDSLDMLVKELGEPFNPNIDGSKLTNRSQPNQSNIKVTQPNKTVQKSTTTTTMAKGTNSPTPVSSSSIKTINKIEAAKAIAERNIKAKSVATVRPTVQQNLSQAATKLMNSNDNPLPSTRTIQSSRSGSLQNAKITSGSINSSKVTSPIPSTSRKQISAATSTTGSSSNLLNSSKNSTPMAASKRIVERSQTTIIKPEKPQIKDPAEDPLSLENIENESVSDSDSFIFSDVSADTFVTLSDVDYDERHIIELSNDSNYERTNLDKIRGSTPSPTVSDDYKSDKDDTPTKMTTNFVENSKEGSVLERNANATAKFRVRQYVDTEATTSRHRKQETLSSSNDKLMSVEINSEAKDTLLERIDTVLSVASDNETDHKVVEKHIDEVVPDIEVEIVTDNKEETKEKKADDTPDSAIAYDSHMDVTTIAKPGVIQEPSTTESMEMDMREIVEEVVEKGSFDLNNEDKGKTIEQIKKIPDNDHTTNETISVTTANNTEDVVMLECTEKDDSVVITTENIDESVHQIEVVSEQIIETVENAEINENLNTKQSDIDGTTNKIKERVVNEKHPNEIQEAEEVLYDAVETTINKIPNLCEADEVRNELQEIENSNEAQEKLGAEMKSDIERTIDGENVNSKVSESEIEKDNTKAVIEKDTEQEKSDLNASDEINEELQLQKHEVQNNLTTADTTTPTEETKQNEKYENENESSTESANPRNENEKDCATSSQNAKELQEEEEEVVRVEPVKKMRGTDKQRVNLRRSQTPMCPKFTEIKSKKAPEKMFTNETKEDESKAAEATVDKTADDMTNITDTNKDASAVSKDGKLDEVGKRTQFSRNKSNTHKVDSKIDDKNQDESKSNVETDKTNSETQRKSRYDKKEDVPRTDRKYERHERSQTPRGRKTQKTMTEVAVSPADSDKQEAGGEKKDVCETEISNTIKDADAKKIINETIEGLHLNIEDQMHELSANEQMTPRHDKRVRGLVVSLKKTDLSKVLNEKLLRKINTKAKDEMPTDLQKSENAAATTADKTNIDLKEQEISAVRTKGESKELTRSDIEEKDDCVKKSTEEGSKGVKVENTMEKAKEDIKHDKSKDKVDASKKDEKSVDKSKRYSKYETPRSKSRRDRTTDKSVEKLNEHSKFMKFEDKAEHSTKDEKSLIKENKDSRIEKSADDTRRYSKGEKSTKSTERSKRDSKYERSTERTKKDSKEDSPAMKSKTDSKDSTDRAKKYSKDEKSLSSRKYENATDTVKKESKEKHEHKIKGDSKEAKTKSFSKGSAERAMKVSDEEKSAEKSKSESKESTEITMIGSKKEKTEGKIKRDSVEEKSAEKSKSESKESTEITMIGSKKEKSEGKTKRDSAEEKSAEKLKSESKESIHKTKKASKEEKSTRVSRYDKSTERARKNEKSDGKANKNSNEEKTPDEAKIDLKHEKSADRSKEISKEGKERSDSKEGKTSATSIKDCKEVQTLEKLQSDSKYEKSTERVKKDFKNSKSETIAPITLEEEKPTDKTIKPIEKTQEPKTKSEDDTIDYRKLKWKNEKYTPKIKSVKDTKNVSESELKAEEQSGSDALETEQSKEPTLMEIETADKKTAGQNAAINEKLKTISSVESTEIDNTRNCVEATDSNLEESTIESQKEQIKSLENMEEIGDAKDSIKTSEVELNDNEMITEAHTMSESVDNIQNDCCESRKVNETTQECQVNEETEVPTESTVKSEVEAPVTESTEKTEEEEATIESIDKSKEEGIFGKNASGKFALRRGRFYKTREKRVKLESECLRKAETKKEKESAVKSLDNINEKEPKAKTVAEKSDDMLEKKVETEKEPESLDKQIENKTEIVEGIDESKVKAPIVAESTLKMSQAIKFDENITRRRTKSRRGVEHTHKIVDTNVEVEAIEESTKNEGEKIDATIEKEKVVESSEGKTATEVVESTDKLEIQNDTQTADESANDNLSKELVVEEAALNAHEIEQSQTNAGTLEETVNTTLKETAEAERDTESNDVNTTTEITSKPADENADKNVNVESVEAKESLNKNETSKTHEDNIEAKKDATTENKSEPNKQELISHQTPTTKECGTVESVKEPAAGSVVSGTSKSTRHKHVRSYADIIIASQSSQLLSADEDDQVATRRSMRTRAADHSPSNKNENCKRFAKATANQTSSSSLLSNALQKLQKEQANSSRSFTGTTSANLARKRMRDHTPNTSAENNDQEKSLSKKLKWESIRKPSRIHIDDVDTRESEHDATHVAVAQRGAKYVSAKESPASKSALEKRKKLTGTKDTKGSKSAKESAAGVVGKSVQIAKQNTAAEVKQSLTGDNLNTSKMREKFMNASHSATKAETPQVKRKQEHERLPAGTTTTTEANKKRRVELENAQSVKKLARANDENTQQKQISTMHKTAIKQSAISSTGMPTTVTRSDTKTEHAHGSTRGIGADPLQLPVKRFKRLQAIDDYETLNISEVGKEIKAEESDNKDATSKRKSLRAAGPTDSNKATETTHKLTAKQTQQSQQHQHHQHHQHQQQHQQQQQKVIATKQVEAATVSLKDRKIVVPNRTGKDAANTDKSPTKSPGSKVITFKEWLEQQKKSTSEDGGEDVLFEPDESAIRMDKILTATTSELKRTNTNVSEGSTSAKQKTKEPIAAKMSPAAKMPAAAAKMPAAAQTPAVELSVSKDSKKKMNAREAAKKKREAAFTPNKEKQESGVPELSKQTPPAAKHGRIEKVVTTTPTQAPAQFKRPSLPQRLSRLTPSRFSNRTPTPADARMSLHGTQHNSSQITPQRPDTKVKLLRKLRVRINRSTVAAYFKNFNLNKVKEQVDENSITTSHSMTDITLESVAKPTDPLTSSVKSIVIQPRAATTPPQLPTLTARPNVVAAAESNDVMFSLPVPMPALTKVPPAGVEETSPTKSQENQDASQTEATDQQFGSIEELSLLTPMKCVTVPQSTNNSSRSQQHQQQQQKQQTPSIAPVAMREKRSSTTSSSDISTTQRSQSSGKQSNSGGSSTITAASSIANDSQLPFTPVVPKEEVVDEHTLPAQQAATDITTVASADNAATTNSLASRTLAIAAATNSALNQTPSNDPSGYYGLTPTQLDSNGTRLYSFLHPAKYNRNHGCVLLDYCCPNLDGPMPAIDPTRIHAQVQAGVRELPAYIVMTTKLITRADLEANKNVIPASIRQKVEKITADASNASTNQAPVPTLISAPNTAIGSVAPVAATVPVSNAASTSLTPTITALQKHLPSTTIITPKLMPAQSTATMASQGTTQANATSQLLNVSDYQRSLLRTSVRQFDARLKKFYYRIAMLSFSDRQTIIEGIINSTTLTPKDVDCAVRLIDEYAAQIGVAPTTSVSNVANAAKTTAPATQSVSKAVTTQTTNTVVRTTTSQQQSHKPNSQGAKTQVAVLDKDNSLLGYQVASSPMPMSKSTISTRSSIMSTSITGTTNTSLPNVTTTSSGTTFSTLKAAQDSPRIFYTKPPMRTSTPIATTTSSGSTPLKDGKNISLRSTPRIGREVTIRQIPQKLNSVPVSSKSATANPSNARRLPTLMRNPHLTAGSSAEKSISETITTRSAVTVSAAPKRMTRATAAAKVIVITQNNDGNNVAMDECILPDGHENTEIKHEKVDDDFVGGN